MKRASLIKHIYALLSINEIFDEIKKLKAYVDKLKINAYPERNKINILRRAIDGKS